MSGKISLEPQLIMPKNISKHAEELIISTYLNPRSKGQDAVKQGSYPISPVPKKSVDRPASPSKPHLAIIYHTYNMVVDAPGDSDMSIFGKLKNLVTEILGVLILSAFVSMLLSIMLSLVYPSSLSWASWALCPGETINIETWGSSSPGRSTSQYDFECRGDDGQTHDVSDIAMLGAMVATLILPIAVLLYGALFFLFRNTGAKRSETSLLPPAPPMDVDSSIEERLNKLEDLHHKMLISDEEYKTMRDKILNEL